MHVQEGLFLDPSAEHIRRVVPQLHRWTNITVRQRDKTPSRFSPQWVQQIPLLSKRCSPGFISCLKPHVGAWKIELHILCRLNYRILKVSFFAESGGMVDLQHLLHVFGEKKYSCFLPRLVIRKQSLSNSWWAVASSFHEKQFTERLLTCTPLGSETEASCLSLLCQMEATMSARCPGAGFSHADLINLAHTRFFWKCSLVFKFEGFGMQTQMSGLFWACGELGVQLDGSGGREPSCVASRGRARPLLRAHLFLRPRVLGQRPLPFTVTLALFCDSRETPPCLFLKGEKTKNALPLDLFLSHLPSLPAGFQNLGFWFRPLCSLRYVDYSVSWDLTYWWIFKFLPITLKSQIHMWTQTLKTVSKPKLIIIN